MPANLTIPTPGFNDGEIKLYWGRRFDWRRRLNLRVDLLSTTQHRVGYLCLLRGAAHRPLLADINLISGSFATALSNALARATAGERLPITKMVRAAMPRAKLPQALRTEPRVKLQRFVEKLRECSRGRIRALECC